MYLNNQHMQDEDEDVLYHFGLAKGSSDFRQMFSHIKFVCCGGSSGRMKVLADRLCDVLQLPTPSENLSKSERFYIYSAGPVLCISHGIGVPSMSVMLNETLKLLHHAQAENVRIIRVGTSGGIGLDGGTVVVSNGALNGLFKPVHVQYVLGERIERESKLDADLCQDILRMKDELDFPIETGITLCCDDFYEGQGRLDGAFCDYDEKGKMDFLKRAYDIGVRNIEMESTGFASFCTRANVKGAIVCVVLLNRLEGDQIFTPKEKLKEWEKRPIEVVSKYILSTLKQDNSLPAAPKIVVVNGSS